jgi:DNA-binding transcriptional regulator YiaG
MQNQSPRRKRLTPTQRKQLLAAYRRSELPQDQFAAKAGVGLSTLGLWLRQEKSAPQAGTTFLQVPNLLAQAPAAAVYRLRLPGGAVLEIGSDYGRQELEGLLQLLKVL